MTTGDPANPWTPDDEGNHHPVMKEWWTTELLFKTNKDNKKWNLMTSLAYEHETPSCFFQYVLFDITSKKFVLHKDVNDDITKLISVKNRIDLHYEKTTLQGLYPAYHLHVQDDAQGFVIDVDYTAASFPHWIAQEITNGYLPMGLNFYRYGFLPNCDITGTMMLHGNLSTIKGKGYLEHAWGNWSYQNPLQTLAGVRKTLDTYLRLGNWWLSHHHHRIPQHIGFSSENNMFGYDWIWGICKNNWSIFYGNSLFWVNDGPSFGTLYVTPDGKNFWEFCDVQFKYNNVSYIKEYDVYYPSEMELVGHSGEKTIRLRFWGTTKSYEYISPHKKNRFYKAFILGELPGQMEGIYQDTEKTIPLQGDCKMVLLRQAPQHGHNAIQFKFLLPPQGVGMFVDLESQILQKNLSLHLQLAPCPQCYWKMIRNKKSE